MKEKTNRDPIMQEYNLHCIYTKDSLRAKRLAAIDSQKRTRRRLDLGMKIKWQYSDAVVSFASELEHATDEAVALGRK